MKPRFELHPEVTGNTPPPELMDSGPFDLTEQRFAASLEAKPQFVLNDEPDSPLATSSPRTTVASANDIEGESSHRNESSQSADVVPASTQDGPNFKTDVSYAGDSWRDELAVKMKQYRVHKRPRPPRYPSLQLKFEALESGATARALPSVDDIAPPQQGIADSRPNVPEPHHESSQGEEVFLLAAVPSAKILEFPAPLIPPPQAIDELAEPILEHPRILEVPDVMPPPPALGGILMEPSEQPSQEKRQGFELPLIAAPFSKRILAGAIDTLIIGAAFAVFAYIFLKMASVLPPVRQTAGPAAGLLLVFWAVYQYLMLVHSGSTPGLKLAKLHLSRFDGTSVPLKLRRWRFLASLLSGLSLGLGYAWCFLDEDQLCWHDRITHTYMAPATPH